MTVLSVNWGVAFTLAGISVCVVFAILVILVFVLQIFSMVAKGASKAPKTAKAAAPAAAKAAPVADASEADMAAVATALYLYMNNAHDEESGVLTIANTTSAWHSVLNPRL